MLKTAFSMALIIAAVMAGTGNAAIYADDPNTFLLIHAETTAVGGTSTPDDVSITGRTANDLMLNAWNTITLSAGYDGLALDFINATSGLYEGNRGAQASNTWPNYRNQVMVQGWFWFNGVSAMPMSTTYGGSNAPTCYLFSVSTGNDSGRIFTCTIATGGGSGGGSPAGQSTRIQWSCNSSPSATNSLYLQFFNTGLASPRDFTSKWVRITATGVRGDGTSDPNFNQITLSIYDPSSGITDVNTMAITTSLTQASGRQFRLGWMSSKTSTVYRGFRGKVDEFRVRDRVDGTPQAYAPTPANGGTVSPTTNRMLQWTKGLPRYSQPVTQNVYFGTDNPPVTQIATGITDSSIDAGAISLGNTYYWRVDTYDAGRGVTSPSKVFSFMCDNIPPTVNLGSDQIQWLAGGTGVVPMTPTVVDVDSPEGALTYAWTQLAGPAAAVISPTNTKNTSITFSAIGSYYFQLSVADEKSTVSDVVRIQVFSDACAAGQAMGGYPYKLGDVNLDCKANFLDFAAIANNWAMCNSLAPGCNP